jgi:hypothetical protein
VYGTITALIKEEKVSSQLLIGKLRSEASFKDNFAFDNNSGSKKRLSSLKRYLLQTDSRIMGERELLGMSS